jgi:PAS domain S-box-containing protein
MIENPDRDIRDVILDSINEGVFTVDRDLRITSFNRAAERITGVSRGEAIGCRCAEVFRANICEEDCSLQQTMATGRPAISKTVSITNARSGNRVPVSVSTAPIRDKGGRIVGGVETFRDLTQVEELRREIRNSYSFHDIIGRSKAMRKLFDVLPVVAASHGTVLIRGASGTGKELVAQAIHDLSPRRKKRFVAINCGALPDTLLESELFGHKAGAFTDARSDRPGRFAAADGGTIFLDEIGDVSPAMQVRLLRVLQERAFVPLGSVTPVKADVRVVAATHRDLGGMVREGRFREDLFYRINVIQVELPPLCERREDIPLLIEHFIARLNRLSGREIADVSDDVRKILLKYDYPGNVRELENILEHAFVLCTGGLIHEEYLPAYLQRREEGRLPLMPMGGLALREIERIVIEDALRRHGGNRAAAAKELGINPSTLFRKIRTLRVAPSDRKGRNKTAEIKQKGVAF